MRLNTNESPLPPPDAWREELLAALAGGLVQPLPRPAGHRAARRPWPTLHGVTPDEVFCANGSNEVLQCLLLAYGGPGRTRLLFEPTYALHSHIARITGTAVVEGARDDDFQIDLDDGAAGLLAARATRRSPSSARPTTRPGGPSRPARSPPCARAAPGLVVVDEAYGQFAPWSALDAPRGRRTPGLVVTRTFSKTWSMAGARLGYLVADPAVVAACEAVALPYHLDARRRSWPACWRCATCPRWRPRVALHRRGARAAWPPRSPTCRSRRWPSDANFILFRPRDRDADEVWRALLAQLGARPQLRRAGPACAAACGSPSGPPRRTTASCPP